MGCIGVGKEFFHCTEIIGATILLSSLNLYTPFYLGTIKILRAHVLTGAIHLMEVYMKCCEIKEDGGI